VPDPTGQAGGSPDASGEPSSVARAIYQALADGDWDRATSLAEANWSQLTSYEVPLIRAVADALPADYLDENPRWVSVLRFARHSVSSGQTRITAMTHRPNSPALTGLDRLVYLADASTAARGFGEYAKAVEHAAEALSLIRSRFVVAPAAGAELLPTILFLLGMSFEAGARIEEAVEVFGRAYAEAIEYANPRVAADSSGELAWLYSLAGRRSASDEWLERHLDITSISPAMRMLRKTAHLALASRAKDRLDFETARAELDLVAATPNPDHRLAAVALRAVVDTLSREVAPSTVIGALEDAVAVSPRIARAHGLDRRLLASARAFVDDHSGVPEHAVRNLESDSAGLGPVAVYPRLAVSRFLVDDYDGATADADQVLQTPDIWPRAQVAALTVKAAVAMRRRDVQAARDLFEQAVQRALDNQIVIALSCLPHEDFTALVALAFAKGAEPDGLAELGATVDAFPPGGPAFSGLTPQQSRVVALLAQRLTLGEAAERLGIARNTAKVHIAAIYSKLGVSSREGMIAEAKRRGLI